MRHFFGAKSPNRRKTPRDLLGRFVTPICDIYASPRYRRFVFSRSAETRIDLTKVFYGCERNGDGPRRFRSISTNGYGIGIWSMENCLLQRAQSATLYLRIHQITLILFYLMHIFTNFYTSQTQLQPRLSRFTSRGSQ